MSEQISQDMLDAFREDAIDTLSRWGSACVAAKSVPLEETYAALMRCAHNLKGNSALIGFNEFSTAVHRLEEILISFEKNKVSPNAPALMTLILEMERFFSHWVDQLVLDQNFKIQDYDALNLLEDYKPTAQVEAKLSKISNATESAKEAAKQATSAMFEANEQVRIPSQKLDVLVQLVGELTLAQAILSRGKLEGRLGAPEVQEAIALSEKITQNLKVAVLDLRMLPLISLYKKLERAILEISAKLQKPIQFNTSGQEISVDKAVISRIFDPLMHLVRNAVDHGIESLDEREKVGKSNYGNIYLSAELQASGVLLRLRDDGRGLNYERIREKAIAKGLTTEDRKHTDEELASFIFLPSFSTAHSVTDISGRGVGLDIVLKEIHVLGGTLQTLSKPGQGTEFIISLPTNVSLIDVMIISSGGVTCAIPTQDIGEVLEIHDVKFEGSALHENMILLRDRVIPVQSLGLFMAPAQYKLSQFNLRGAQKNSEGCILVIYVQEQAYGFHVDAILGQQQIFARPVKGYLNTIAGLTGSTVLSSGDPAMIINIKEIASEFMNKKTRGNYLGDHTV